MSTRDSAVQQSPVGSSASVQVLSTPSPSTASTCTSDEHVSDASGNIFADFLAPQPLALFKHLQKSSFDFTTAKITSGEKSQDPLFADHKPAHTKVDASTLSTSSAVSSRNTSKSPSRGGTVSSGPTSQGFKFAPYTPKEKVIDARQDIFKIKPDQKFDISFGFAGAVPGTKSAISSTRTSHGSQAHSQAIKSATAKSGEGVQIATENISKGEVSKTVPAFPFWRTVAQMTTPSQPVLTSDEEEAKLLASHLQLLSVGEKQQDKQQVSAAPIFTHPVLKAAKCFSQYGFLAGDANLLDDKAVEATQTLEYDPAQDPRLYFNIAAPSSAFICGSQGSGKSHTLSCLLENCLMKSDVSMLNNPLAGLVFHYDTFSSDEKGSPCEAAYLSSAANIQVRVLCSPTNIESIKVGSRDQVSGQRLTVAAHICQT